MTQELTKRSDPECSHLDPEQWVRFSSAETQEQYFRNWLALQCSRITHAVQGVLIIGNSEGGAFEPVARWPEEGEDPERLADISERVIEERCGLLVELHHATEDGNPVSPHFGVAYPILIDDRLYGVVAVEVLAVAEEQLKAIMERLQWGVAWMELFFRRGQVKESEFTLERLTSAVDLLAGILSEPSFESASMALVTELATQLKCERVSLAIMRKRHAKIKAVSHSAQFGKRMNLIRAIGRAMDEAVVQRKEIFYPSAPDGDNVIVRDHEELARQHGAGSILTIPVYGQGKYYGALTLERPSGQLFNTEEAVFCRSIASLLFPALEIKRLNDRILILKIKDTLTEQIARLFGPRYLGRKLVFLLIAAIIAFFSMKMGDYRISANTVLEGAVKRVVVAPFDGYVKEAPVRAGDVVDKGILMCTLDDRDLNLERLSWLGKRSQYQKQHQEALAKQNWAETNVIKAQLEQATAKLNLVMSQLKRTKILAPFNGIILSGDLSQRLGGSVNQGEILYEVAPLNAYRVILEVDERRIADVKLGQDGQMILSALPQERFEFIVEKITPITNAKEGGNYFRVEAKLENVSTRLRPGMEGIGKIYVDKRKLISVWTRDLREWVRLWIWSWWP